MRPGPQQTLSAALWIMMLVIGQLASAPSIALADDPALAVFEQRILPIFRSAKPSSCVECHLSGVDLKDYIRATQQETFASLLEAGLVDAKAPDKSKLLEFIQRKPAKPSLITDKLRQVEYEAFRAWITAASRDATLLPKQPAAGAPTLGETKALPAIGPKVPVEVVRQARRDRVLESFVENVWNEVSRCAPCHSPTLNQKQVQKHGARVSWIKPNDPWGTLESMVESGVIDLEQPDRSPLITKPSLQVEHAGGQKMMVGDRSYQQFRRFLDDYAETAAGHYRKADELPKPAIELTSMTEIWFKLTGVPAKFDKRMLQVDFYQWTGKEWTRERVATSERAVFGGGNLWQHSIALTARRDDPAAVRQMRSGALPPGRYLAKLYVDVAGKLARDPAATLGAQEFVGQVEFESKWPAGYGRMTVVAYPQ